jgi:cation diffusion facilitator family transporter
VGIGGSMLGVSYLDLIAAVAVSLFVIRAGVMITWNAYKDLVDTAVEGHLLEQMKEIVENSSGVMGFHKLRTRKIGGAVLVDLHLLVVGNMTVKEAHDIADRVEHRFMTDLDVHDVTIHVEVYRCDRPRQCTFDKCEMIGPRRPKR